MKKKIIVLVFTILVFSLVKVWAQIYDVRGTNNIFASANVLYKEGKYVEAINKYTEINKAGFESAELYFNLGNCFFKNGQLGKSLLNYERARIFMPMDSDLRSNYNFVRSQLILDKQYFSKNIFFRFIDRFFDSWSVDFLAIFVLVVWIIIFSLLAIRLVIPTQINFTSSFLIIAIILGVFVGSGFIRKISWIEKSAIIIDKEVEAKFEPIVSATTHFKIYEGNIVQVIDKNTDWIKIKRSDGKIGWVLSNSIERIKIDK